MGGIVFHFMNRGVRRLRLFESDGDYRAFLDCAVEAKQRVPVRLLAYCVMPNHFHMVAWPAEDGELSAFMRLMTAAHSTRWHAFRGSKGTGAVYQDRYRAFAVQTERYFFNVCRYVERNPVRAGLVDWAEDWSWSSLPRDRNSCNVLQTDPWPLSKPPDWTEFVNGADTPEELRELRRCVRRGRPFGDPEWVTETAKRLDIERTTRRPGRPRVEQQKGPGYDLRRT